MMPISLLLITPPFIQLNTPYPATPHLKGFLQSEGYDVEQADLGIELVDGLLSPGFLTSVFPQGHPLRDRYLSTIDSVKRFLRNEDPTLASRIAARNMLPEGARFRKLEDMEWAFGTAGTEDKARYLSTLYIEDIADAIRSAVDPNFDLVRYAEHICTYAESFDTLYGILNSPTTAVEDLMLKLLEHHLNTSRPSVVGFTIPFPGCLLPALRCGQFIKRYHPDIQVVLGGGFPNTEWRHLEEPRLFDFADYVLLDDGELPLLRLSRYFHEDLAQEQLLRTWLRRDGRVVWVSDESSQMPVQVKNDDLPSPDFSGLPMALYLSMADMTNPMQRLWSCGRWNKLMMAHGCYWAKCAFCDTTLDYIARFDAPMATTVVNRMEHVMSQTGVSGFHFVDEALPPNLLRQVCLEILRRGLQVSFWGNIRFDKSYDAAFCRLLAEAGCIAVSGGLELASDRLLKLIGKGVSVSQTFQATRNFRDAGIMVHTYLMYGFPTETLQETIDALDNVRRMFREGVVQSAFWHRYAMTAHSPSGCNPEKYGAHHLSNSDDTLTPALTPALTPTSQYTAPLFCRNEIPFHYDFGYDLDAVGQTLRVATYNYMNGLALDRPARKWFKSML